MRALFNYLLLFTIRCVIFGKMLANFLAIENHTRGSVYVYSSFRGVHYPVTNQIIHKYILQEYARMIPIEPFSLYVFFSPPSSDHAMKP